jgi:hypothetical protein
MFKHRHERQAAEQAERHAQELDAQRSELSSLLEQAKSFNGVDPNEVPELRVQCKPDERVYMCLEGAALIEPRRGPGHYEGRSQGVSVRVPGTKSMRYRVGASHGTFVQGAERPTPIDTGQFVITNLRGVFLGEKQTREWAWPKLIGITHAGDAPWSAIAVSNRAKVSGVAYDAAHERAIRFMLDLAVSRANGTADNLVRELTGEIEQVQGELQAAAPPPPSTPLPPPPPVSGPPA